MSLESLDSGRPEMQTTLARAEKFLNLVALLAALLFKRRVALQPEGQAQQRARQAAAAFVLLSGLKAQCDCVGVLSVCPAARAL